MENSLKSAAFAIPNRKGEKSVKCEQFRVFSNESKIAASRLNHYHFPYNSLYQREWKFNLGKRCRKLNRNDRKLVTTKRRQKL